MGRGAGGWMVDEWMSESGRGEGDYFEMEMVMRMNLNKKGGNGAFREFAHAILLSNKITLGE